ncbi:hypothetical protein [Ekhidna sp.]|nr:hypothetical protein [Ekhidna sp.]
MKLEQFLSVKSEKKNRKYRTVNVDHELHHFLKKTSSYYNIPMSDLVNNILANWKDEFQEEIKNDMLKHL